MLMSNSKRLQAAVLAGVGALIGVSRVHAAAITPGDLVVYQVTGAAALSSAAQAVFLDEYSPAGTLVQQIPAPTAANGVQNAVTASGTATSEGQITLSPNGQFVAFTGYDAAPGTTGVASTTAANDPRVVGLLNVGTGAVDTSTVATGAYSGNNIRGATTDGTTVYTAGTATGVGGIYSVPAGSTTATQVINGNDRVVNLYNGNLYVASGSATAPATLGIAQVNTSTGSSTSLGIDSGSTANPYAFAFENLGGTAGDTVYVADQSVGIEKYSLVNGSYVETGTIAGPGNTSSTGLYGLSAVGNGGAVTLYVTSPTGIFDVTDTSGYDGTLTGSLTTIATASTNTAFRGIVATTATPEPASLGLVGLISASLLGRRRRV